MEVKVENYENTILDALCAYFDRGDNLLLFGMRKIIVSIMPVMFNLGLVRNMPSN